VQPWDKSCSFGTTLLISRMIVAGYTGMNWQK
jgi:hypothetical protein